MVVRRIAAVFVLASLPVAAFAAVHEDVVKKIQDCTAAATTGEQQQYCLLKATPRKCRGYVRDRRIVMSMAVRQQWQTCLHTCEGANLYSRSFGECSTPSDPGK
jgi:hypothetical protein